MHSRERYTGYFFVGPATLFLFCITIIPIALVVRISFLENYFVEANARFVGLANFIEVLSSRMLWTVFKNTAVWTVGSVFPHLLLGLLFALLLNIKSTAGVSNFFRALWVFPWLVASAVVASIWRLVYQPLGILNGTLVAFGLVKEGKEWLSSPALAMPSLIIANVWKAFPFYMLAILAGLQAIPESLYEAASLDGASALRRFWHITLPSISKVILTVGVFDLIWTFKHFDLIYLLTGGGPVRSTEVFATYIYNVAFESFKFGQGAAVGILMLFISIIGAWFYLRLFLKQ